MKKILFFLLISLFSFSFISCFNILTNDEYNAIVTGSSSDDNNEGTIISGEIQVNEDGNNFSEGSETYFNFSNTPNPASKTYTISNTSSEANSKLIFEIVIFGALNKWQSSLSTNTQYELKSGESVSLIVTYVNDGTSITESIMIDSNDQNYPNFYIEVRGDH